MIKMKMGRRKDKLTPPPFFKKKKLKKGEREGGAGVCVPWRLVMLLEASKSFTCPVPKLAVFAKSTLLPNRYPGLPDLVVDCTTENNSM